MDKTARDYQLGEYHAVRDAFRSGLKRVVVDAATGTGKSVLFSFISRDVVKKSGRVLLLVNRDNLCKQAAEHLGAVCGRPPSIEKAGEIGSRFENVIVGSVQSMQGKRLKEWDPDWFRLIIVDEVHLAASKTYRAILDHFKDAYWLGVTATVERHDRQGIFFHFQQVVYEFPLIQRSDIVVSHSGKKAKFARLMDAEKYIDKLPDSECLKAKISEETIPGAIDQGWLVPLKFHQLPVPVTIDEKLAHKKDISEDEEAFALEPYLQKLAIALKDNIDNRITLCFLPDCESSMAFAQILRDIGVKAEHVEGVGTRKVYEKDDEGKCVKDASGNKVVKLSRKFTQADYDGVIERWKSGETQVVTNASILYIGFDYPAINCVCLLRMLKSTPMLKQMIGRGTRPVMDELGFSVDSFETAEERREFIANSPKPDCVVLDLLLQCEDHNFSSPPDLIADFHDKKEKKDDPDAKVTCGPIDLESLNENFQRKRVSELEEKLRKVAEKVANQARKKSKATQVYLHDILKAPTKDFDVPASEKQISYLHKLLKESGKSLPAEVKTAELTKYQASRIIGRLIPKRTA